MTIQMMQVALRVETGDPLSKLCFLFICNRAVMSASGGLPHASFGLREIARFAQCSKPKAREALYRLEWVHIKLTEVGKNDFAAWPDLPMLTRGNRDDLRMVAAEDREEIYRASRYRCVGCGKHRETGGRWAIDHIIPHSLGGLTEPRNLQLLCWTCNSRKGALVGFVDFLAGRK